MKISGNGGQRNIFIRYRYEISGRSQSTTLVGSIVLILSEYTPPSQWPLAIVTQIHTGDDGIVAIRQTNREIGSVTCIVLSYFVIVKLVILNL